MQSIVFIYCGVYYKTFSKHICCYYYSSRLIEGHVIMYNQHFGNVFSILIVGHFNSFIGDTKIVFLETVKSYLSSLALKCCGKHIFVSMRFSLYCHTAVTCGDLHDW